LHTAQTSGQPQTPPLPMQPNGAINSASADPSIQLARDNKDKTQSESHGESRPKSRVKIIVEEKEYQADSGSESEEDEHGYDTEERAYYNKIKNQIKDKQRAQLRWKNKEKERLRENKPQENNQQESNTQKSKKSRKQKGPVSRVHQYIHSSQTHLLHAPGAPGGPGQPSQATSSRPSANTSPQSSRPQSAH